MNINQALGMKKTVSETVLTLAFSFLNLVNYLILLAFEKFLTFLPILLSILFFFILITLLLLELTALIQLLISGKTDKIIFHIEIIYTIILFKFLINC